MHPKYQVSVRRCTIWVADDEKSNSLFNSSLEHKVNSGFNLMAV
jgi:hypothetical protein